LVGLKRGHLKMFQLIHDNGPAPQGPPLRALYIIVKKKIMEDKSENVEKKLHELGLEIQEFKAEFSDYSEKVPPVIWWIGKG
jgi:hypothetical protein